MVGLGLRANSERLFFDFAVRVPERRKNVLTPTLFLMRVGAEKEVPNSDTLRGREARRAPRAGSTRVAPQRDDRAALTAASAFA